MVKRGRQAQKVVVGDSVSSHGLTELDHVSSSFSRRPSFQQPQPHTKMSVSLNPSSSLGFRSTILLLLPNGALLILFVRTIHTPGQTLIDNYEPQLPTRSFQSQNYCSKGTLSVYRIPPAHILYSALLCTT
jgi:hypothetical protein